MPTPAELAQQLDSHKGYRFSAAYLWGAAPFRPDDEVYRLVRAAAVGTDRLDLVCVVDGSEGPEVKVSLWNPGKFKAGRDDLRISGATKVSFGTTFEATLAGDKFKLTLDGKPGDEFAKKDQPALRLVVAPS